jgi:hypothetical protein
MLTTASAWASSGYTYTNISGTSTDIGTGRKNTALILATDANAPAAKACKGYRGGGKTDWFLPSKDELAALYVMRVLFGISDEWYYWSSSQGNTYDGIAWFQYFGDGRQFNFFKNLGGHVRAVRAF